MGAMSATWYPFSMAMMAASKATMVLPDPTSPCSRRRMGKGFSMSDAISLSTRFCAAVGWNGRIFLMASRARLSRLERDSGLRLLLAAFEFESQLQKEKLFKDQPDVRRGAGGLQVLKALAGIGPMDLAQRVPRRDQA